MKILILDDHEAMRLFVKQQVLGITPKAEIYLSANLDSATKFLTDAGRVDYVICDLELNSGCSTVVPEMCYKMRIPFMIYSSHVNKVLTTELQKFQVRCYVSKTSGIESLQKGLIRY